MLVRTVLLALWLLLAAAVPVLGARDSSLAALQRDVASGRATSVTVAGGLTAGPDAEAAARSGGALSASGRQAVTWRDGLVRRWVLVRQDEPGTTTSYGTTTGTAGPDAADVPQRVATTDIGDDLRATTPALVVRREPGQVSWSSGYGWRSPDVLGLAALLLVAAGVGVLLFGPAPWRATRWAWVWLVLLGPAPSVGVAFLALSGPPPWRPGAAAPSRPRLSGGWGLVLALVLSAVAGWAGW